MKKMNIGLQLYSVSEDLKRDFKGTMRTVADQGYKGVEFAWNYGNMRPEELRIFLDDLGLECIGVYDPGGHIDDVENESYVYAKGLNAKYITTGITNRVNEKEWPGAIKRIKKAAELAAQNGLTLLYHNHWQELQYVGDERALDKMLDSTDPAKVRGELDVGFLVQGGVEPVDYIQKYAGRLPKLHMRDIKKDMKFTEIGKGIIDFDKVIPEAAKAGVQWLVYEQQGNEPRALERTARSFIELEKKL